MTSLLSRPWTMRLASIVILATVALTMFAFMSAPAHATAGDLQDNLNTFGTNSPQLGKGSLPVTTAKIINAFISILGVVAVVIILAGGFKWMVSGGQEEKVGEARQLIVAGIIGLVIVLAAYAIASFVISQLTSALQ